MLDASTTGLIRFLLQRIDDDDDRLRLDLRKHDRVHPGDGDPDGRDAILERQADNKALRGQVGEAQRTLLLRDLPIHESEREHASAMLRSMAGHYDGHRAYRHEWQPERVA